MYQIGKNYDIGIDSLGNIVLKATNGSGAQIVTNLKYEWYLP